MDATFAMNVLGNITGPFELYLVAKPISELTTNEYNAMIAGVAHGIIQGENLTEIQACLGDVKGEATATYHAFEDLLGHHWSTGI